MTDFDTAAYTVACTKKILEHAMMMRAFDRGYNNPEKAWVEYIDRAVIAYSGDFSQQYIDMGYLMNFALMPEVGLQEMFPDKYPGNYGDA